MGDFGLQFSPASTMNRPQQQGASGGDPNQGVQDAIRTLSLRVPRVSGAQGFSPLINAPGGQGVTLPGGMSLDQLLMQLFGGQRQPGQPSMGGSMGQSFQPSFTPGITQGEPSPGAQGPFTPGGFDPTPAQPAPSAPSFTPSKAMPDTSFNEGYQRF